MKFYSEKTKKLYDTAAECSAAEAKADREEQEKEAKRKEIASIYNKAKDALELAKKNLKEAQENFDKAYADYLKINLTTKNYVDPKVTVKSWSGEVSSLKDLNDALFNFFKN